LRKLGVNLLPITLLGADLPHPKLSMSPQSDVHTRKIELREGFSDAASGSYPAKTIAKNFVSLITYPHSDSKHFEKPPPAKRTYIFYENFLREPRYL
jgi:hypothetical protein